MLSSTLVETLTQFGILIALAIFVIVVFAMGASGTSIGRYMVPQAVIDVMSKLLPSSFITDATATAYGDFQLDVSGNARLKKVNVHRSDGMTIAWAFDPTIEFPQTGTFALNSFRHNLKSSSSLKPERVKERIETALADTLAPKHFQPTDANAADIWASVFGALEKEVPLDAISETFDRPGNDEWRQALSTAMTHDRADKATTFGRGSLVLDIIDSKTMEVLCRAAAIADVLVEVYDSEKERRTSTALAEMLKKFPPHNV